MSYDHKSIEQKWQKIWEEQKVFAAHDGDARSKFYVLVEFPYPSGDGLHVGHCRSYTALDIVARKKRMEGKNVLFPIGFDAFGLPTENYAIKHKIHPRVATDKNIANFTRQLKSVGFSFDWARVVDTTDEQYYKWTQWLFLQFLKAGLAYQAEIPINWCPACRIGLANEEVVDGKCERCGAVTEKRLKKQWMLAITKYAERLLNDLETVDYLPRIKAQQQNWIGKSEGAEVEFRVQSSEFRVQVFTTRVDTLFGVTYVTLAPENALVDELKPQIQNWNEVENYRETTKKKSDLERTELAKEKTGVELKGVRAVNPANGEEVPIFIADYVLASYGTGAVMAVPAHDERDFEFAKKFGLPIKTVVQPVAASKKGRVVLLHGWDGSPATSYLVWLARELKERGWQVEVPLLPHAQNPSASEWLAALDSLHLDEQTIVVGQSLGAAIILRWLESRQKKIKKVILTGAPFTDVGIPEITEICALPVSNKIRSLAEFILIHSVDDEVVSLAEAEKCAEILGVSVQKVSGYGHFGHTTQPHEVLAAIVGSIAKAFTDDGILVDSGEFSDLSSADARTKITEWLEQKGLGKKTVNYKLRDWVFSRQRYWGEPIPIVHCERCGVVPAVADFAKYLSHDEKECDRESNTLTPTGGDSFVRRINHSFSSDKILADNKNEEDALSRQVGTNGGLQTRRINSSISPRILASGTFSCQTKFKIVPENERVDFIDSPAFGRVALNWKRLKKHLRGRYPAELLMRLRLIPAVLEVLRNTNKSDPEVIYARRGEQIFTIVLAKTATGFELKTFYRNKKLTTIWRELSTQFSLPLTLPHVENYEPTETGESPLSKITEWANTTCPKCGGSAKRETDTMPNWAGSSWYFLRYVDPQNDTAFAAREKLDYWTPVDLYNGGMEHTVLHLLYSRFWHKFLFDQNLVPTSEPYQRRVSHGMILGPDGEKMSKSRGNVINPDSIIAEHGADTLRIYEMFIGPFDQAAPWSTRGVEGVRRFLERAWRLFENWETKEKNSKFQIPNSKQNSNFKSENTNEDLARVLHQSIKKIGEDIENFRFNTSVSQLMILVNAMSEAQELPQEFLADFLKLLAPFAPHLAEELWTKLGNKTSLSREAWPTYDPALLVSDTLTLAIQVNGKLRDTLEVSATATKEEILMLAKKSAPIQKWLAGKTLVKEIFVPGKLVSFVVKE